MKDLNMSESVENDSWDQSYWDTQIDLFKGNELEIINLEKVTEELLNIRTQLLKMESEIHPAMNMNEKMNNNRMLEGFNLCSNILKDMIYINEIRINGLRDE